MAVNPFFKPLSPPIKYAVEIEIKITNGRATVAVKGKTTVFPAFEMYAAMDGGEPKTLVNNPPKSLTTYLDLLSGLQQDVAGVVYFSIP